MIKIKYVFIQHANAKNEFSLFEHYRGCVALCINGPLRNKTRMCWLKEPDFC